MTEEEWRAVGGYEGLYEVSDQGRVRRVAPSHGTHVGRIVKPVRHKKLGYCFVHLGRLGPPRRVHQLVARAFLGEPPSPRHEPDHLNNDRTDNRAANLAWVTRSENLARAARAGRIVAPGTKLNAETAAAIRALRGTATPRDLAPRFGVSRTTIHNIFTGKTWRR